MLTESSHQGTIAAREMDIARDVVHDHQDITVRDKLVMNQTLTHPAVVTENVSERTDILVEILDEMIEAGTETEVIEAKGIEG